MTLKEQLEKIWLDSKVRSPRRPVHWCIGELTGLPSIKNKKKVSKRAINRLTKEFSWRK